MTRIAFCDDDAALLHQMQDFLEQYRALYAETAQAHGLPDQTDSEELWLELGSN